MRGFPPGECASLHFFTPQATQTRVVGYNHANRSRRPMFVQANMHEKRDVQPVMLALPAFSYLKTVKYYKPPLSLIEQKDFLRSRGLVINSEVVLDKLLRDFGYARVDPYSEVFTAPGSRDP